MRVLVIMAINRLARKAVLEYCRHWIEEMQRNGDRVSEFRAPLEGDELVVMDMLVRVLI